MTALRPWQRTTTSGNYVIFADFCDRAGPFLKFKKNHHIAARKPHYFGSVRPQNRLFSVSVWKTVTTLVSC